jgi:pimeloyl-ACP methyl ester carboxylesterase
MATIDRGEGKLVYDLVGEGPLVVLVCGMGDRRTAWRHVLPGLVAAGYRCATLDPRGHGESDATFSANGPEALAEDVLALIDHLGGPAVVIGHSAAAAAAVKAAADAPDRVCGLVLVGPVLRDGAGAGFLRWIVRAMLLPPWGAWAWGRYYRMLFKAGTPADHEAHVASVIAAHRDPARRRASAALGSDPKSGCAARISEVRCGVLALVGDRDPDYDPRREAEWIRGALPAQVELLPGVGHDPHMEIPERTLALVTTFLAERKCRAA